MAAIPASASTAMTPKMPATMLAAEREIHGSRGLRGSLVKVGYVVLYVDDTEACRRFWVECERLVCEPDLSDREVARFGPPLLDHADLFDPEASASFRVIHVQHDVSDLHERPPQATRAMDGAFGFQHSRGHLRRESSPVEADAGSRRSKTAIPAQVTSREGEVTPVQEASGGDVVLEVDPAGDALEGPGAAARRRSGAGSVRAPRSPWTRREPTSS